MGNEIVPPECHPHVVGCFPSRSTGIAAPRRRTCLKALAQPTCTSTIESEPPSTPSTGNVTASQLLAQSCAAVMSHLDGDRVFLGTANVQRQWVQNVQKNPR